MSISVIMMNISDYLRQLNQSTVKYDNGLYIEARLT